jgi:hypothetical protein
MSFVPFFVLAKSSKGISLISIIIIAALIYAGLNAYAYVNPDFQLNRISIVYLLRSFNDNQRKADLQEIKAALLKYYNEERELPASNEWCGPIYSILRPEVKNAISGYFGAEGIPQDPSFRGSGQDYFYRRESFDSALLLTRLENPPPDSPTYNYDDCFDWPGDDVFNYQVKISM